MTKTKLAIIGLGGVAQIIHLPILSKMEDAEIVAVCDSEISKAKSIASKYNVGKYYREADKMLEENPDISAIIIATQTNMHKDVAIKCLEAEKDILVEKPVARNYREAKEIIDAAKKYKRKIMVAMNNRFRNDMMMQRTFIKAKEIGEVFYIKTGWIKPQSSNQRWILEKDKSGGGVFLDNGIAMLDLGLWIFGFPDVKSVTATNYFHNTKSVEDSSIAMIRFKNNAVLTIEVSWGMLREGELFYCNVYGKEGSSSINPFKIYKRMDGNLYNITPKKLATPANYFKKSYEYELKHFVGAVRGSHNIISTGEDALKVMEIADAIYKSAKTNKEIIFK
ncbi:MAG: Gfo/Idh/MocA family oxidoreductase [Ignavibacteria bacterium]|nr:Gfo/Idh/MocA family oxidoreductase [Ignavibacteria bacterium]MBK7158451.1 Gfo/Idh/MocA family oxidoreductase [Ignavibacteria bacterium]MBK7254977.1 Gfo/Idh/MocA family oxidoreductase [Ignavibacteria bacterium]MBK9403437.1 Gfo/Idh/MocA family oxidoreductase [Ignavibacteria bacterium]